VGKIDGKEVEGRIQGDEVVRTLFRAELHSTTVSTDNFAAVYLARHHRLHGLSTIGKQECDRGAVGVGD
jgi:hypothetical protein